MSLERWVQLVMGFISPQLTCLASEDVPVGVRLQPAVACTSLERLHSSLIGVCFNLNVDTNCENGRKPHRLGAAGDFKLQLVQLGGFIGAYQCLYFFHGLFHLHSGELYVYTHVFIGY